MNSRIEQYEMKVGRRPALGIPTKVMNFLVSAQWPANLPLDVDPMRTLPTQRPAANDL